MFLKRIKSILKKASLPVGEIVKAALQGGPKEYYDELEEKLILSDIGLSTSDKIVRELKRRAKSGIITEADVLKGELKTILSSLIPDPVYPDTSRKPSVIIVTGINGAGKTTSIAKLSSFYGGSGKRVLLGACDTFRAAADEQLNVWAQRTGASIFLPEEQKDPAAVAFLSCKKALDENFDILIVDTAGRMHTNSSLMTEIGKIYSVLSSKFADCPLFSLMVIDANTGKNALEQAKQFMSAAKTDAVFLTKIDGTAKGGASITIADELGLPISFIGAGERAEDLWLFDKKEFIESILG